MNPRNFSFAIIVCLSTLSGCMTMSYTPAVVLDVSPVMINKSVRVDRFVDKSPDLDREKPFFGASLNDRTGLAAGLDLTVTNAICRDFEFNGVFKTVNRFESAPDFVISGEIVRFYSKYQPTTYGLISLLTILPVYTWYFGPPIRKNEIEIELKITVTDRSGSLVKSYSKSGKVLDRYSMYKAKSLALQQQTNRVLSDLILQIRNEMIRDLQ